MFSHLLPLISILRINSLSCFCVPPCFKTVYIWWCVGQEQWNQWNFFYHRLCHLVPITPLHQTSRGPEIQAEQSSYQLTPLLLFLPLLFTFSWTLLSVLFHVRVKKKKCLRHTGTHPSKLRCPCIPSHFPSFISHLTFVHPLISDLVSKLSPPKTIALAICSIISLIV